MTTRVMLAHISGDHALPASSLWQLLLSVVREGDAPQLRGLWLLVADHEGAEHRYRDGHDRGCSLRHAVNEEVHTFDFGLLAVGPE